MDEVYGQSPAMMCLPSAKKLNELRRAYIQIIHRLDLDDEMQVCCDLLSETECMS